jgi:Cell wall-associated hydrolases (invasion-associated proteins)
VFFNGLGHVGMYVGHGRFIHSPHAGDHVRVARFDRYYRRSFVGATRPAWHPLPRIPRTSMSMSPISMPDGRIGR